jgi:hypothetical protein
VTRFDGLPFSSPSEAFALAVVLPMEFSAANRCLTRSLAVRGRRTARLVVLATVMCAEALNNQSGNRPSARIPRLLSIGAVVYARKL